MNKIEYNTIHYNFTYLLFHRNLDHLHIIFVDIHGTTKAHNKY